MLSIWKWLLLLCLLSLLGGCAGAMRSDGAKGGSEAMTLAEINIRLGVNYLEQQQPSKAREKLQLALKQASRDPAAWYAMGYYYETVNELKHAQQYYLQALNLNPRDGKAQNNYGVFLCRHGEYRAAIEHFLKAIDDPDFLAVGETYENAGRCALKIPDKLLARQYFLSAIRHNPNLKSARDELMQLG